MALCGRKQGKSPRGKLLDGEQEAKVIALRLGTRSKRFANWSVRLLAEKVVELEIVALISYETVRRTPKKSNNTAEDSVLGDSARCKRRVCNLYGKRAGNVHSAL